MTDPEKVRITTADLMNDEWVEVVDGELVEVDTDMMGFLHMTVIHNMYDTLKPFVKLHKLGYVHGDGLKYILHFDENGVQTSRTPDLAFYGRDVFHMLTMNARTTARRIWLLR